MFPSAWCRVLEWDVGVSEPCQFYLNWNPRLEGSIFTRQSRPPIQILLTFQTSTCHKFEVAKRECQREIWNYLMTGPHQTRALKNQIDDELTNHFNCQLYYLFFYLNIFIWKLLHVVCLIFYLYFSSFYLSNIFLCFYFFFLVQMSCCH